jgi:hypothetical protein
MLKMAGIGMRRKMKEYPTHDERVHTARTAIFQAIGREEHLFWVGTLLRMGVEQLQT